MTHAFAITSLPSALPIPSPQSTLSLCTPKGLGLVVTAPFHAHPTGASLICHPRSSPFKSLSHQPLAWFVLFLINFSLQKF